MSDFTSNFGLSSAFNGNGVLSTGTSIAWAAFNPMGASTGWPAANLAIFVPVRVSCPVTVYKMVVGAGLTAAGNFDVGIYDASGNRLVSSGATAKGASVEHILDVTDTRIGPGLYYLAMSADGTNNYIMVTPSGTSPVPLQKTRLLGILNMATAYTLPTTATFAAATNVAFPCIAAYTRDY